MKLITERAARAMQTASLFVPVNGRTLEADRFDGGKYRGKPSDYIGREVPVWAGCRAVYPVSRRDSDGPYVALMCMREPWPETLAAVASKVQP